MGFQGFPAGWPEEYQITEAREHLKALRQHFREQLQRQGRRWPGALMPTDKKLTQPWFPLGSGKVHLTVYAWQAWTGVDLYVPRPVARLRFTSDGDWHAFLARVRSLPDRDRVWVTASRWRLINHTQGRQTGPMMNTVEFAVRAEDLVDRRKGKGQVVSEALRQLACSTATKALTVAYRYYFQDTRLTRRLQERAFGDRLIGSARNLLHLYGWFSRAGQPGSL